MPLFACSNAACSEKDKKVFLPVNLPIADCPVCRQGMASAAMKVAAKNAGPAVAPAGPARAFALKAVAAPAAPAKVVDPLLAQLQQKAKKRVDDAIVNEVKTQIMVSPGGAATNFNLPVKFRFWESDRSKQSREVTIEIPILVHGAATGLNHWTGKGWSAASFTNTVHPLPGGAPGVAAVNITDDVKKAWSAKINKCWGRAGVLWSEADGQQIITLKFQFRFVDDAAEAAAEVICTQTSGAARGSNPTGTIDAVRWGFEDTDPDTRGPICHEVGHLIGNPDEYYTITFEGQTKAWGNGYQAGAAFGIMNNPDNAPLVRNYRYMARKVATQLAIPLAEADLLLDLALPGTTPKRNLNLALWD